MSNFVKIDDYKIKQPFLTLLIILLKSQLDLKQKLIVH
jgi:hypothetical protein